MSLYIDSKYINLISGRVRNFRKKNAKTWNFSCPFCGDSAKKANKARGYVFEKKGHLFFKCHNCTIGKNMVGLLKHLDEQLADEYIAERFKNDVRKNLPIQDSPEKPKPKAPPKFKQKLELLKDLARVSELDSNHECVKYVRDRKIPEEFWRTLYYTDDYRALAITVDEKYSRLPENDPRLIIPFLDANENLIYVQGRAIKPVEKRYRYMTLKIDNECKKLFGADRVLPTQRVYVFEGPIDSLFIPNSVGTADSYLLLVEEFKYRDVVYCFDNEPRSKEIIKLMEKACELGCKVVIWDEKNTCKDVNDMILSGRSVEDVKKEIDNNTFSGMQLQLRLAKWSKL